MQANALGTVNINDAFFEVIAEGGCVIDTSSTSAYMAPSFIMPKRVYPLRAQTGSFFMDKNDEKSKNVSTENKRRCRLQYE